MSEQSNELRRINWSECFPFTRLFRTFKLAIHPSKLGLALAAVLITGVWGWFLDAIWSSTHQPIGSEVNAFWQVTDLDGWRETAWLAAADELRGAGRTVGIELPAKLDEKLRANPGEVVTTALQDIEEGYDKAVKELKSDLKDADKSPQERLDALAGLARSYRMSYKRVAASAPQGVCKSFVVFEAHVARQLLDAAKSLNLTNGLSEVLTARVPGAVGLAAVGGRVPGTPTERSAGLVPVNSGPRGFGALSCVVLALRGVQWLLCEHFLFFLLFGLPALAIWSLFGGAICRMAAMDVARQEQISPRTALAFARRKLVGLFTAPLFPVLLVVGIGVFLMVGGLILLIPGVGEVVGGLLLVLALPGGFLMAAVVIGAVAGGALMWPTIAVEGSDSFDAMSRSYSYVFSRPWRAAFYALVATVYGAITYLFVRFFILVVLKTVRLFVGLPVIWWTHRPGTGDAAGTKLDTLWPAPTFEHFRGTHIPIGMENWESAGAFLICLWVTIMAALLCAFLASFFLSGSTIIYYLLRREVDATDYEDVYVEEEEEPLPAAPIGSASDVTDALGATAPAAGSPTPPPVEPPAAAPPTAPAPDAPQEPPAGGPSHETDGAH